MSGHSGRAHSKFSASGAERWLACPGSVALSEGVEDKETPWALEGTQAHEILEIVMRAWRFAVLTFLKTVPQEMVRHAQHAAQFIYALADKIGKDAEVLVETRVYLDFIHKEMFGTFDGAVVEHFGWLHVFDYKFGKGHSVSPKENLQMIFYALGLAHKYEWNFKMVRLWIIQPRVRGYDGPLYWDLSIDELRKYEGVFRRGAIAAEEFPDTYNEGGHCHWCKAKSKCPLKLQDRNEKATKLFKDLDQPEFEEF